MTEGDVRLVTLSHLRTHYLDSYTKFIPLPEMDFWLFLWHHLCSNRGGIWTVLGRYTDNIDSI